MQDVVEYGREIKDVVGINREIHLARNILKPQT